MDDLADRTCIMTRTVADPADMIRFVLGPDGSVVPDLKRKLPGRGVWVTAKKSLVQQAVLKSAFSRGLKANAKASADLPDLVERLIADAALGALGFARKAGECIECPNEKSPHPGAGKPQGNRETFIFREVECCRI